MLLHLLLCLYEVFRVSLHLSIFHCVSAVNSYWHNYLSCSCAPAEPRLLLFLFVLHRKHKKQKTIAIMCWDPTSLTFSRAGKTARKPKWDKYKNNENALRKMKTDRPDRWFVKKRIRISGIPEQTMAVINKVGKDRGFCRYEHRQIHFVFLFNLKRWMITWHRGKSRQTH